MTTTTEGGGLLHASRVPDAPHPLTRLFTDSQSVSQTLMFGGDNNIALFFDDTRRAARLLTSLSHSQLVSVLIVGLSYGARDCPILQ